MKLFIIILNIYFLGFLFINLNAQEKNDLAILNDIKIKRGLLSDRLICSFSKDFIAICKQDSIDKNCYEKADFIIPNVNVVCRFPAISENKNGKFLYKILWQRENRPIPYLNIIVLVNSQYIQYKYTKELCSNSFTLVLEFWKKRKLNKINENTTLLQSRA